MAMYIKSLYTLNNRKDSVKQDINVKDLDPIEHIYHRNWENKCNVSVGKQFFKFPKHMPFPG